ncbi:MAG: HEPN domain-containing protein [Chitinophagaceae bacterium]|nr:HEPN domain-containing protein [Chitinophagaceae bacterium]
MPNPVEQIKFEYDALVEYLTTKQPSLLNDLNKNFRKVLLLSAGSYFENQITTILINFVREKSNNDSRIISFLEKQAISQKYHTLFSWGERDKPESPGKNANTFFKLFGDNFKVQIDIDIKSQNTDTPAQTADKKNLNESIEAFIEIGHLRNILVHSNFAAYNYDQKTTEEIFSLFKKAEPFLTYLIGKLN